MSPLDPPPVRQHDARDLELAALREDRPVTPTTLAVAATLDRLLDILENADTPLTIDPAGRVAKQLWAYRIAGDRGSHDTDPVAVWVRTFLPRRHPELTSWQVAVYGYRVVVSWDTAEVSKQPGSLVMLMPYGVNLFLDQFHAGAHRRVVARRHWWSRRPRHVPRPAGTPPAAPIRSPVQQPPSAVTRPEPPVAQRGPAAVDPPRGRRLGRRRPGRRPDRPPPIPGQPIVTVECGCQVVYGRHGYDPTDPDQQAERLVRCADHAARTAAPGGR